MSANFQKCPQTNISKHVCVLYGYMSANICKSAQTNFKMYVYVLCRFMSTYFCVSCLRTLKNVCRQTFQNMSTYFQDLCLQTLLIPVCMYFVHVYKRKSTDFWHMSAYLARSCLRTFWKLVDKHFRTCLRTFDFMSANFLKSLQTNISEHVYVLYVSCLRTFFVHVCALFKKYADILL